MDQSLSDLSELLGFQKPAGGAGRRAPLAGSAGESRLDFEKKLDALSVRSVSDDALTSGFLNASEFVGANGSGVANLTLPSDGHLNSVGPTQVDKENTKGRADKNLGERIASSTTLPHNRAPTEPQEQVRSGAETMMTAPKRAHSFAQNLRQFQIPAPEIESARSAVSTPAANVVPSAMTAYAMANTPVLFDSANLKRQQTLPAIDTDQSSISISSTEQNSSVVKTIARETTTTPAQAHVTVVRDQIAAAITASDGETKIEISLDPPELGRVTIDFDGDRNGLMRVYLSAHAPETAELLRRSFDLLQEVLDRHGLGALDLQMRDRQKDFLTQHAEQRSDLAEFEGCDECVETPNVVRRYMIEGRVDKLL